ncbi:hypothetical protein [Nocardioides sp. B-3]|uniref:hypothetical protein n=1 Tax=Nocardioides sp. B-3 TaxID=2895565 RepID=UPI0021526B55|nr:hypothetical protein [Nocardioides sp. B-3]UUZ58802.1 hypothetical protein LP418_22355 [Nocardioides sp. B-3]
MPASAAAAGARGAARRGRRRRPGGLRRTAGRPRQRRGPVRLRGPDRGRLPAVHDAPDDADPSASLQPFAENVRTDTDVDFVVVMALDRTRYTHPNPDQIGKKFIGDLGSAPEGRVFTREYEGTLGPSMRSVVPVTVDGTVVALVSVGITIEEINRALPAAPVPVAIAALAVLAGGLLGALADQPSAAPPDPRSRGGRARPDV